MGIYTAAEGISTISNLECCDYNLYIVANNLLYSIDISTGKVMWTADGLSGGNYNMAFDEYGNIYVSADFSGLTVVNKYGTVIYRGNSYRWVSSLKIEDGAVSIYEEDLDYWEDYEHEPTPLETIDIKQFRPNGLSVAIDGELISFDQQPIIQNSRTLVPLRKIFEKLGAKVDWNGEISRVLINTGNPTRYNMNTELFSCFGLTYDEVTDKYGVTTESDSWYGGEYHKHGNMKSYIGYLTDATHQKKFECNEILFSIDELFPDLGKKSITIDELETLFGKCKYYYYYNSEYMEGGPASYRFENENYEFYTGPISPATEFSFIYGTIKKQTQENTSKPQEQILEEFVNNKFESQSVAMQANVTSYIANYDAEVLEAYQKITDYSLIDIDKDNKKELIVSSEPIVNWNAVNNFLWDGAMCLSIWDCDDNGNIKCILAKAGQQSRAAFKYFIIEDNGETYIFERTSEGNSGGRLIQQNRYVYNGNSVMPSEMIYLCEDYSNPEENIATVNSIDYSLEYVDALIETNGDNSECLHSLFSGYDVKR